ncbi:MAG: hypothetical protein HQM16_13900 [Deltaproteobacteria bacterium]|nr:hypothetical protein [Deltaproteobacteria bacterium]
MTTPIFVLRDDAGKLYPCQADEKKVTCEEGSEETFTVTNSRLAIGIVKDVDIRDKSIVLLGKGQNGAINMARAFGDAADFTSELHPQSQEDGLTLTTPTYDLIFGLGISGQKIDAPLNKGSNFSYIAGIEVRFGCETSSTTYEAKSDGPPLNVRSDEPYIVDAKKSIRPSAVVVPKTKVALPTMQTVAQAITPAVFESESLFDTAKAVIKDDRQLADYVRSLLNVFKNSTDVVKIRLVGKADARGNKVLAVPLLIEKANVRGVPDIYFNGNDQLARDRAIAVQQWFIYYFKNSKNLDVATKAEFANLRYAVFVKGTSEDLPVVVPVEVEDDYAPQTIPWDDTVIGNTLDRENYRVDAAAEMEDMGQRGIWYKLNNGELTRLASADGATHLLFALRNKFNDRLDWFAECLDLNRVVNPDYSVVDEIDAVYSEHGFDTKPLASPALMAFKDPKTLEEAFGVDEKFNETTTRFDVQGGTTIISARYIPINRDAGEGLVLSPSEKRYLKAAILEAVAVPGRQRLIIHMNNVSFDAAAGIRKFIVLHIPSDTIAVKNVVSIETHEAAKPVSISIGTIAGGRVNFSLVSPALQEYMKTWYATQADATIPAERRSFPGDADFSL